MKADTKLTWAILLGRWTDFARSAVALPAEGEPGRWKRAVADVIGLQAITHALNELDLLDPEDWASSIDRASVGVDRHIARLAAIWDDGVLPDEIVELMSDARCAIKRVQAWGLEWVVDGDRLRVGHPADLIGALQMAGFKGDLFVPVPGVDLFRGCVACVVRCLDLNDAELVSVVCPLVSVFLGRGVGEDGGDEADGGDSGPMATLRPRQAYRRFDFGKGGPVRDELWDLSGEPLAGQPLLVAAMMGGEVQPVTLPMRAGGLQAVLEVIDLTETDGDENENPSVDD